MRAELEQMRADKTASEGMGELLATPSAEAANNCPICLSVMVDAAALSCGHSGCLGCLQVHIPSMAWYSRALCQTSHASAQRPEIGD